MMHLIGAVLFAKLTLMTAYCEVGYTYSGEFVRPGIAACPAEDPIGTEYCDVVTGQCWVCKDRGSMVNEGHIDIWMSSCDDAIQFGRQYRWLIHN